MSENLRSSNEEEPEEIPQADLNNPESGESQEKEQPQEKILDALESAFEKGNRVNLTVSEPSGKLRTNAVFVEGFESGVLYISDSKGSHVMGIPIDNVKRAEAATEDKESM